MISINQTRSNGPQFGGKHTRQIYLDTTMKHTFIAALLLLTLGGASLGSLHATEIAFSLSEPEHVPAAIYFSSPL